MKSQRAPVRALAEMSRRQAFAQVTRSEKSILRMLPTVTVRSGLPDDRNQPTTSEAVSAAV
jgi:hypothetical protein